MWTMPPSKDVLRSCHKTRSTMRWAGEREMSAPSPNPKLSSLSQAPRASPSPDEGGRRVPILKPQAPVLEDSMTPASRLPTPGCSDTSCPRAMGFTSTCGHIPSGRVWFSSCQAGNGRQMESPTPPMVPSAPHLETKQKDQGSFVSRHTQGLRGLLGPHDPAPTPRPRVNPAGATAACAAPLACFQLR